MSAGRGRGQLTHKLVVVPGQGAREDDARRLAGEPGGEAGYGVAAHAVAQDIDLLAGIFCNGQLHHRVDVVADLRPLVIVDPLTPGASVAPVIEPVDVNLLGVEPGGHIVVPALMFAQAVDDDHHRPWPGDGVLDQVQGLPVKALKLSFCLHNAASF